MRIVDILPSVAVEVESAPESLIRKHYIEATRDFCRRTRYWREDLDLLDHVANVYDYDLFTPVANTEIVDVITAERTTDNKRLTRQTPRNMSSTLSSTGDSVVFSLVKKDVIRIGPVPPEDKAGAIAIRVALQPTSRATEMDDRLISDFGDQLIYGALARLMRMPGKPWGDKTMASYYLTEYNNSIGLATAVAEDEYTRGVVRTVRYGGY